MKDPIEEIFGKRPKKGYKITYTKVETYSSDKSSGIIVNWSAQGIGFGQLTIYFKYGVINIDNEGMSKAFCDEVIKKASKDLEDKKYLHRLPLLRGHTLKFLYKQYKWKND